MAVAAAAVAMLCAAAGPAAADLTTDGTSATSGPSGVGARAQVQVIRSGPGLSGGSGRGGGGTVTVSVPVPCYYMQGGTGLAEAQANASARRGDMGRAAQQDINRERSSWAPNEHLTDTDGRWYIATCTDFPESWELQRRLDFINAFYAANPTWRWVPNGTLPPQPPVPRELLMQIASETMQRELTAAAPVFNPAGRSLVNLETWAWLPPGSWRPSSVTARAGAVEVTVTATPQSVGFDGYPDGSLVKTGCSGGGRPYDGSSTDCSITFSRSSSGQPGNAYSISSTMTWGVTAAGAPLQGPPVLTRVSAPTALAVWEAQVVSNWTAAPR